MHSSATADRSGSNGSGVKAVASDAATGTGISTVSDVYIISTVSEVSTISTVLAVSAISTVSDVPVISTVADVLIISTVSDVSTLSIRSSRFNEAGGAAGASSASARRP